MDWNKWSDFLNDQYGFVCGNRPSLRSLMKLRDDHFNWGDTFGELEQIHGRQVHEAVLEFIKTEQWPEMADAVAALLGQRIFFAMGFVDHLKWASEEFGMNAPYGAKTDEEMVSLLLIDVWRKFGYNDLEGTLMSVPCVETTATRELGEQLWNDIKAKRSKSS